MQIRGPDASNHKNKHSNMFLMVKKHKIDTKLAFVAPLVQKLSRKRFLYMYQIWCFYHKMNACLDFMSYAPPPICCISIMMKVAFLFVCTI